MGNIVRYAQTCWLSLKYYCNKELKNFPALKSMFLINKRANEAYKPSKKLTTKFKRLQSASEDPLTEVYLYFYTSTLLHFHYLPIIIYSCREVIPSFIRCILWQKNYIERSLYHL